MAYQSSTQRLPPVRRRSSGACQDTRQSKWPCETTFSTLSVSPDSIYPPKPNPFEPPRYVTRMPGGVGGAAPRDAPLSRSLTRSGPSGPFRTKLRPAAWYDKASQGSSAVITCTHLRLCCLNEYELIRKYRCQDCGDVMMCVCDEDIGSHFLSHQLSHGVELETQRRVAVTLGFQPDVCRECRGLPSQAFPVAAGPGRTSKIRRYYWRELAFQTMERFEAWAASHDPGDRTPASDAEARQRIEREVLEELKALHATSPKYTYSEESQEQIIRKYAVEVIRLDGAYVRRAGAKDAMILDEGVPVGVEMFVQSHFQRLGFETLVVESVPFHVVFGVFMWLVIQDPADPRVRTIAFGDRNTFDQGKRGEQIWTQLPDDFGTRSYGKRRAKEIDRHLSSGMHERGELQWLFDYWLSDSAALRQYLWAHRQEAVDTARKLIDILPARSIAIVLRYLVGHYWGRYVGWPDLLVYRGEEFFFAEVKSSGDKLSEDQKRWIRDNHEMLRFPFKLVKVHRAATVDLS